MHKLEEKLGYIFINKDLFQKSLAHKSWSNEMGLDKEHNEKLEFLGDAVIDLALSELLYEAFPQDDEGDLSKKRASLVNEDSLSLRAQALSLGDYLKLGKGELLNNGGQKPRLLASGYEALMGAIYLDGSWDSVRDVIKKEFYPYLLSLNDEAFERDYKTRLQEKLQGEHRETPSYQVTKEDGPAHDKVFHVQILFQGKTLGTGLGKSKKSAEQNAAKVAIELLEKGSSCE